MLALRPQHLKAPFVMQIHGLESRRLPVSSNITCSASCSSLKIGALEVIWLGHDSFLLKADRTVVVDPFRIEVDVKADYLLITHEHFDHCSIEDTRRVVKPSTVAVAIPDCRNELSKLRI